MAKEETEEELDDFDLEESEAEEEEEIIPARKDNRGRPPKDKYPELSQKRDIKKPLPSLGIAAYPKDRPSFPNRRPERPTPARYVPFIQEQREGVLDKELNQPIAENIWAAFANIINRLERIEIALGGNLEE